MLTGKPVLSFAYGLGEYEYEYENEERGLFYDLDHVFPGAVCRDFGQLACALETAFDEPDDDAMQVREWKAHLFFDHRDDQGSWRVVDRVRRMYVKDDDLRGGKAVENQ